MPRTRTPRAAHSTSREWTGVSHKASQSYSDPPSAIYFLLRCSINLAPIPGNNNPIPQTLIKVNVRGVYFAAFADALAGVFRVVFALDFAGAFRLDAAAVLLFVADFFFAVAFLAAGFRAVEVFATGRFFAAAVFFAAGLRLGFGAGFSDAIYSRNDSSR